MKYLLQVRENPVDEAFKMCPVNKFRKTRVKAFCILEISNIFADLEDQECVFEETTLKPLSSDSKRHKRRITQRKCQEVLYEYGHLIEVYHDTSLLKVEGNDIQVGALIITKKRKTISLNKFKSDNKFGILEDNPEEDTLKLIKRLDILQMKRNDLKKCRQCNFKKRKCSLNPLLCQAAQKICHACQKPGHFPQSLCCKKSRQAKKKKSFNFKVNRSKQDTKQKISAKTLKLIKKRIMYLESLSNTDKANDQAEVNNVDVLPDTNEKITMQRNYKENKQYLLKLAGKCAAKFETQKNDQLGNKSLLTYCSKKLSKYLKNQPIAKANETSSMLSVLSVYDQMFYNATDSQDSFLQNGFPTPGNDVLNKDEQKQNICKKLEGALIPQFDGLDDINLFEEEEVVDKKLFSVNCEQNEIPQLMNFFRSFHFLWKKSENHLMCNYDSKSITQNCFFCLMRSSCLRLSTPRTKGPKSIKLTEFASQLNKYEINPCEKWTDLVLDLINFTQTTLELLECDENPIKSLFGLPGGQCQNCRELTKPINEFIFEVNSSEFVEKDQIVNLEDIINNLIKVKLVKGCPECNNSFQFRGTDDMFLIIKLSHAINVKILNSEDIKGKRLFYKSHYQEGIKEDQICMSSFFNCDKKTCLPKLNC